MAILKEPIQPRNFEVVRDRIAEILQEEFDNQVALNYSDLDVKVCVGRFAPFDKTELPLINVCTASIPFSNGDVKGADGASIFNIDTYVNAAYEETQDGDTKAAILLDKILGMIWAILENPAYDTLGFTRPSITRVEVSRIDIAEYSSLQNQDAMSTIWGRLQLTVVANEETELATARIMNGYETKAKLGNTSKGYNYLGGV
jgi:hypothetical protein